MTEEKKEQQQRVHCFHCGHYGHYKAQDRSLERTAITNTRQRQLTQTPTIHKSQNVTHVAICTKSKSIGTELKRHLIREENDTSSRFPSTKLVNTPYPRPQHNQKPNIAAPTIRGKSRRESIYLRRSRKCIQRGSVTECNEEPTQDWQRRWNVGMILRNNARHPDKPKPLPEWITESPENYATVKRPLPESKTERVYLYDMDYRCDPWDEPTIYDSNKLSFKVQIPNPQT